MTGRVVQPKCSGRFSESLTYNVLQRGWDTFSPSRTANEGGSVPSPSLSDKRSSAALTKIKELRIEAFAFRMVFSIDNLKSPIKITPENQVQKTQ